MSKLTYEKYKGLENIIIIDLHNDYKVIAISSYNKENSCYEVELYLKENTVDKWDLIEKAEISLKVHKAKLNAAILKQVATLFEDGFFDYYIERYEYELKCFDMGNALFEKERFGDK